MSVCMSDCLCIHTSRMPYTYAYMPYTYHTHTHAWRVQEKKLQLYSFEGVKEREWVLDSVIRYIKVCVTDVCMHTQIFMCVCGCVYNCVYVAMCVCEGA